MPKVTKTEHAGAKNGGGHHGPRSEAKALSKSKRRRDDRKAVSSTDDPRWRSKVGMLASELTILHATDPRALEAASVLRAVADSKWPKLADVARKARHWTEANNRGPRSRVQEADGFASRIERGLAANMTPGDLAADLVRCLRVYPLLAEGTRVPRSPAPWSDDDRADVVTTVAAVLEEHDRLRHDAERCARAVLRALGSTKASNAYKHRDKRASRAK